MACTTRKKVEDSGESILDTYIYESKKEKAKAFVKNRYHGSRRDQAIDVLWDGALEGLELMSDPIKYALHKISSGKITPKMLEGDWFRVKQMQKDANELINAMRTERAQFAEDAGALKKWLSTLSKEDSRNLVKALNGDIAPDAIGVHLAPTYESIRKVIDANADMLVRLGVLDDKSKIKDYLKRYYMQYIDETGGKGSAAFSTFYKRKDLDYEARIGLGMIEDASFVVSKTLLEQKMLIQKAQLLKQIADKFALDTDKEGYVRISNETAPGGMVKKWGALAGRYIPKEVARELHTANVMRSELYILEHFLYPVTDFLKVTLTVKNPVTHLYNTGSNIILASIKGDIGNVGRLLYMRHTDRTRFDALVKLANKHGLNSQLDILEDFHIDLAPDKKKVNIVITIMKNIFMTADSSGGKAIRHLYDWEDKIFKLASFDANLRRGMDEISAYKDAVAPYVDYSRPLPAAIGVLDKSGLMPFITYQYHSTPAVAKMMLKNPVKALVFSGGVMALNMSAFQNDEDEFLVPEWAGDKMNLFGVQEWHNVSDGWYLNAGRLIPGTKFEFELGGFVKGFLNIMGGKTPLGYNIDGKYDDAWDKVFNRGLTLAENYTPPLVTGRYGQGLARIGLGELGIVEPKKNYYNEDMTSKELALRALGIRHFNETQELNKNMRALVGQWGAGKISKVEMESKLNAVIKKAEEAGVKVDRKRLQVSLKKARNKMMKTAKPHQ